MDLLKKGCWVISIPFLFSLAAVIKRSFILMILCILIHFLLLKIIPFFRGRENVWMFIMTAVSFIPYNLYILVGLGVGEFLFYSIWILGVLRCILFYITLVSIEETIMAFFTRVIWKRQKKTII